MTKLYIMRHGQTYFNLWHKIQGWCDSPLTAAGINQAKAARIYFLNNHIHFDTAYCSTSERASDTLELVTDHQLSYTRLKGLREWGFGSFEAQDERLNPPIPYQDFFSQYGGESQSELTQRITATITEIAEKNPNKTVLIVSHAGAIVNFLRSINIDLHKLTHTRFSNCGIVELNFQNSSFSFVQLIDPLQ